MVPAKLTISLETGQRVISDHRKTEEATFVPGKRPCLQCMTHACPAWRWTPEPPPHPYQQCILSPSKLYHYSPLLLQHVAL
uniref:Uncharacterized protein n=1 Tax=Steinernema glaseri TaxID=37863 RepID=A0A1I8APE7_9BILA